jgi:Ca2+-transporting ATPase
MQHYIFDTLSGVITARGQAGLVAFFMLIWAAMQSINTLIYATNKAWGAETLNWWRLPLKSLGFLGIMVCMVLFGIAMPVLANLAGDWVFLAHDSSVWRYVLGSSLIPWLAVFISLCGFYRLAPNRATRVAEVWIGALCTMALMAAAERLFVIYLKDFATLNAIYGAFGGIMALLLWIYLSGFILIFGACLCAAQAEGQAPDGGNPEYRCRMFSEPRSTISN